MKPRQHMLNKLYYELGCMCGSVLQKIAAHLKLCGTSVAEHCSIEMRQRWQVIWTTDAGSVVSSTESLVNCI